MIYTGVETEYLLEQLIPGHLYSLRVFCSSIGGESDPSDVTQIKTLAVPPASCHPPKISGKPKANSLHLRWANPDYDGGSPVIEFEVQIINPDNSSRIVYRGRDLDCVVAGLFPGRPYLFQVRAFNRAGVRRRTSLFFFFFISIFFSRLGWSMVGIFRRYLWSRCSRSSTKSNC